MINLIPTGGMQLSDAINKFSERLKNKRVLYVIEPNLEKGKIVKFGIAGMDSGKPISRLKGYDITFGQQDKNNKCKGVTIWFLGITEYNRLVEAKNSKVFRIEKKLKQEYKSKTETVRGSERTSKRPQEIIADINKLEKNITDEVTVITRVARPKTKEYRTDERAYKDSQPVRRSSRLKKKDKE
tara:strand:- start:71 stop:622 length:552 start_codon:yes stop_codon:yes gene_type:complete